MTEQVHWRDKQPSQVAYVSQICNVEELETSPAVTQPRISHHQLPAESRRKRKRSKVFLEWTRKGHR